MKKIFCILIVIALNFFCNVWVYAAKEEARELTVRMYQADKEAYYVDILVKISEGDEVYSDFNAENAKKNGFTEIDTLVDYAYDGYVSYSLHFKNADSNMIIDRTEIDNPNIFYNYNTFISYPDGQENLALIKEYSPKIRVALLNSAKNVIHVSNEGTIQEKSGYLSGDVSYYGTNYGDRYTEDMLSVDYYLPEETRNHTGSYTGLVFAVSAVLLVVTAAIAIRLIKRKCRKTET